MFMKIKQQESTYIIKQHQQLKEGRNMRTVGLIIKNQPKKDDNKDTKNQPKKDDDKNGKVQE